MSPSASQRAMRRLDPVWWLAHNREQLAKMCRLQATPDLHGALKEQVRSLNRLIARLEKEQSK